MRRKLKVNTGREKKKEMVFDRETKVGDFITPYKMSVPALGRCDEKCDRA